MNKFFLIYLTRIEAEVFIVVDAKKRIKIILITNIRAKVRETGVTTSISAKKLFSSLSSLVLAEFYQRFF